MQRRRRFRVHAMVERNPRPGLLRCRPANGEALRVVDCGGAANGCRRCLPACVRKGARDIPAKRNPLWITIHRGDTAPSSLDVGMSTVCGNCVANAKQTAIWQMKVSQVKSNVPAGFPRAVSPEPLVVSRILGNKKGRTHGRAVRAGTQKGRIQGCTNGAVTFDSRRPSPRGSTPTNAEAAHISMNWPSSTPLADSGRSPSRAFPRADGTLPPRPVYPRPPGLGPASLRKVSTRPCTLRRRRPPQHHASGPQGRTSRSSGSRLGRRLRRGLSLPWHRHQTGASRSIRISLRYTVSSQGPCLRWFPFAFYLL